LVEWTALLATCGAVGWSGDRLARRFVDKAIPVAIPAAAAAGLLQAVITRPPREERAWLHSFESAFANHFIPPFLGFLLGLWVGIAITRVGLSRWLAILMGALTTLVVEIVTAVAMLITA
jgi:hypothetical protein